MFDPLATRPVLPVTVPPWATPDNPEGRFFVRKLSYREQRQFEQAQQHCDRDQWRETFPARLAAALLCDQAGARIADPADPTPLLDAEGSGLLALFFAVQDLSPWTEAALEAAKKKPLTPSDASSDSSPSPSDGPATSSS